MWLDVAICGMSVFRSEAGAKHQRFNPRPTFPVPTVTTDHLHIARHYFHLWPQI